MVGHSQLDSDMLEITPLSPAADDVVTKPVQAAADEASVTEPDDVCPAEADELCDDECVHEAQSSQSPLLPSPMPLPQPGQKRKRTGLRRNHPQEAALVCIPQLFDSQRQPRRPSNQGS